jgi:hypothetical protein
VQTPRTLESKRWLIDALHRDRFRKRSRVRTSCRPASYSHHDHLRRPGKDVGRSSAPPAPAPCEVACRKSITCCSAGAVEANSSEIGWTGPASPSSGLSGSAARRWPGSVRNARRKAANRNPPEQRPAAVRIRSKTAPPAQALPRRRRPRPITKPTPLARKRSGNACESTLCRIECPSISRRAVVTRWTTAGSSVVGPMRR